MGRPVRRQAAITVIALGMLVVFAARLVQIQAIDSEDLAAQALADRLVTTEISVPRADIVDRHGAVLATSVDRFHIHVDQRAIATWRRTNDGQVLAEGPQGAAQILAPILDVDPAQLEADLTGEQGFAYIAKDVSRDTYDLIRRERIAGVYGEPTSERLYPNGDVAGDIIGFMSGREDRVGRWGLGGIEYAYEDALLGVPGSLTYERGGGNVVIPTGIVEETPAVPGSDVVTTIDRDLQWQTEERLDATVRDTGADWGAVVVMDVTTGDVYTLADSHEVDPRSPGDWPVGERGSRAVSEAFEPGSTAKVITMAALLEEGLATPTTHVVASDRYTTPNGQTFRDSHDHPDWRLTLTGVLARSSNTATVAAGQQLDYETRHAYLRAFGLGEPTGIGLPGESAGVVHDVADWDGRTAHAVLFGQGLSLTAMQLTQVFATIGNDGVLAQPTVVQGFADADGRITPRERAEPRRVMSQDTAADLRGMLESAVVDGTGSLARIDGYRVAGKTGTSQILDSNGDVNSVVASFVGIAPADQPRIVVSVVLYDPETSIWGGDVAAPLFADVAADALQSLGVAPSDEPASLDPITWG